MAVQDHEVVVNIKESILPYLEQDILLKEYFIQCLRRLVVHKGEESFLRLYIKRLGLYCLRLGVFDRAGVSITLGKGTVTIKHSHSLTNDTHLRLGIDHKKLYADKHFGKEWEMEVSLEALLEAADNVDKLLYLELKHNLERRKEFKNLKETK